MTPKYRRSASTGPALSFHLRLPALAVTDGCLLIVGMGMMPSAQAQTFAVLHTFTGPDGLSPYSGAVMDSAGNLYGTTYAGGATGNGTVYELKRNGSSYLHKQLHAFTGGDDGAQPYGGCMTSHPVETRGHFTGNRRSMRRETSMAHPGSAASLTMGRFTRSAARAADGPERPCTCFKPALRARTRLIASFSTAPAICSAPLMAQEVTMRARYLSWSVQAQDGWSMCWRALVRRAPVLVTLCPD